MPSLAPALMVSVVATVTASASPPDPIEAFIGQTFQVSSYLRADVDLNGDGRLESFVYLTDQGYCGSGGCTLVVLTSQDSGYRAVMRSSVTRLPIHLLATSTHGWRDVGVTVAGGGITQPYMARMQFDGRQYPSNPTVAPAAPLGEPSGEVLIGA